MSAADLPYVFEYMANELTKWCKMQKDLRCDINQAYRQILINHEFLALVLSIRPLDAGGTAVHYEYRYPDQVGLEAEKNINVGEWNDLLRQGVTCYFGLLINLNRWLRHACHQLSIDPGHGSPPF